MKKTTQELLTEKFNNFNFDNYQNHEFECVVDVFSSLKNLYVSITCKKCGMGVMRSFTSSCPEEKMTEENTEYNSQVVFRIMVENWLSKLDESCNEMIVKQVQNS